MSRRTVVSIVKWLLFAALTYFVGAALVRQLGKIDFATIRFNWWLVALSGVALTVVYAARSITFRVLLDGYGVKLTWAQSAVVGWIPQIGKYIPGYVASLGGAVVLLRRFGAGGAVALAVVVVMDGLAVLTGMITGSPLLLWGPVRRVFPLGWLFCGLFVIVGIVCLHPIIYGRLLNVALRKMKRAPLQTLPPWHDYIGPVLLGFAQWILAGIALWLITRAITFVDASHIPLFIAIAGLAYTVSYLTPFAPGGLGVREAIFQGTLFLIVKEPAAIAVITMRLVQTIVEILMAVAGWIILKREQSDRTNSAQLADDVGDVSR